MARANWLDIGAITISVLALGASGLSWVEMRRQTDLFEAQYAEAYLNVFKLSPDGSNIRLESTSSDALTQRASGLLGADVTQVISFGIGDDGVVHLDWYAEEIESIFWKRREESQNKEQFDAFELPLGLDVSYTMRGKLISEYQVYLVPVKFDLTNENCVPIMKVESGRFIGRYSEESAARLAIKRMATHGDEYYVVPAAPMNTGCGWGP